MFRVEGGARPKGRTTSRNETEGVGGTRRALSGLVRSRRWTVSSGVLMGDCHCVWYRCC